MFLNQGTSKPEASQEEEKVNGDMASALGRTGRCATSHGRGGCRCRH